MSIFARHLPPECQSGLPPPVPQADPDIGGIGVVLSFLLSAYASFALVFFAYVRGFVPSRLLTIADKTFYKVRTRDSPAWTEAVELIVLVISDQQIVTGVAMLLAGLSRIHIITTYHWQIVVYSAWISSNVHLTTMSILRFYLQERKLLRTIRLAGMLILLVLLLPALFPLINEDWNTTIYDMCGANCPPDEFPCCAMIYYPSTPVHCFWLNVSDWKDSVNPDTIVSYIVLIFSYLWKGGLLYSSSEVKYRHILRRKPERKLEDAIRARMDQLRATDRPIVNDVKIRFLLTCYTAWIAFGDFGESFAASLFALVFGLVWGHTRIALARASISDDVRQSEDIWGFGQIMPLLLLLLPCLAVLESYVNANKELSEDIEPPLSFSGFRRGAIFHPRNSAEDHSTHLVGVHNDTDNELRQQISQRSDRTRGYSPTAIPRTDAEAVPPLYASHEDLSAAAGPSTSSTLYSHASDAVLTPPKRTFTLKDIQELQIRRRETPAQTSSPTTGASNRLALLEEIYTGTAPVPENSSQPHNPPPVMPVGPRRGPEENFYTLHHILIARSPMYKVVMSSITFFVFSAGVILLTFAGAGLDDSNWLFALVVLAAQVVFVLCMLLWSVLPYEWVEPVERRAARVAASVGQRLRVVRDGVSKRREKKKQQRQQRQQRASAA